ncbi:NifB/NifX family molybdenum-iron cluster-binding protein [Mobiluncus curtisii]|uniref:NifB/NifX family molybdenum-iron cluster-binding protein n=1 Tax=Mobiluncus curtisii TaxID=2051 RepID=UPI0014705361|nr:NifB/NifX family molybdenum-iron cluster-binding protein [Mobiluncus curtisii]NMW89574.1 hypothetical protein [Mobiluncus curtisii]
MSEKKNLNIAINVMGDEVGGGLGRARTMVVATVDAADEITAWQEFEVGWDILHEQGPHGSLHAQIVSFMRDHDIVAVVSGHMGPPMVKTMMKLGVLPLSATGDARHAATDAAKRVRAVDRGNTTVPDSAPKGNKWVLPVIPL